MRSFLLLPAGWNLCTALMNALIGDWMLASACLAVALALIAFATPNKEA